MSTGLTYNEKQLLTQLSEGSEEAFRRIFDQFSPRINAFAIRLTQSPTLAEEIVQEVFTKIWQNRQELKEIRNLEAWLVTLARNTGSSMLRRIAHEQLILRELRSEAVTMEDGAHTEEWQQYHDKLLKAVQALPPQQRKVWEMSRQQGMKQQQIADSLGISLYTVKEYIKLSSATLKKTLLKFIIWGIPSFFELIRLL